MSEQLQLVYELNIIPGKAEEVREIARDMVTFNDEGEPGTLRYNVYVNEDETRVTFLEAFLDSEACRFHGERFAGGQFVGKVLERTDGGRLCVFGPASKNFRDWAAEAGFEVEYFDVVGGFHRHPTLENFLDAVDQN